MQTRLKNGHSLFNGFICKKKTIPHKSPQEGIFLTIAIHKRKNISLFLQWKQEWYVNIGGIVQHYCLNFLFIKINESSLQKYPKIVEPPL